MTEMRKEAGGNPLLPNCKGCIHAKTCILFSKAIGQYKELQEEAKSRAVKLILPLPDTIGENCSEYKSVIGEDLR